MVFPTLLAAIVIVMSYGEFSPPLPADFLPGLAVALVAVLTLSAFIPGLVLRQLCRPRPAVGFDGRLQLIQRYRLGLWVYRGLLVGVFAFQVYGLHWPYMVDKVMHLEGWILLDKVMYLLPFLAAIFVSWIPQFFLERALRGRPSTFWQYVEFQFRHYVLFILAPWLVFITLFELVDRCIPDAQQLPAKSLFLQYLLVAGLVFGIYLLWPLAIRFIWSTRRLPEGRLRQRLEALCKRSNTSFREILLWDTPGWALVNACVTGVWGRFRYILLTRALTAHLSEEEIETVFAHEIGHVKLRHMSFYLFFALCFFFFLWASLIVVGTSMALVGTALREVHWRVGGSIASWLLGLFSSVRVQAIAEVVFTALLVGLYWGIGFGFLSRRLECEADLFGVKTTGNLRAFLSALEKIAYLNGITRTFKSWRHFSPARRIDFLLAVADKPDEEARFRRPMRLLRAGLVALFLVSALVVLVTARAVYGLP